MTHRTVDVAVAVGGTAVLLRLGASLHPLPWVTWWCAAPAFAVARRSPVRVAAVGGAIGWAVGTAWVWWRFATGALEVPVAVTGGLVLVQALRFGGVVALFGLSVRRGWTVRAVVAAAAAATAGEFVESLVSPHGALLSLAVTQMDVAVVRPVAAAVGGWGVTALLVACSAATALVITRLGSWEGVRRAIAVWCGVPVVGVALSAIGWWGSSDGPSTLVRVAAVVVRPADDVVRPTQAENLRIIADEVAATERARDAGIDLVVFAEKAFTADDDQWRAAASALRRAAGSEVSVVVGLSHRHADGRMQNEAVLLIPGEPDHVAVKAHLVPGLEDGYTPGHGTSAPRAGMRWSVRICKDLDFPAVGLDVARERAGLLLVPAADFVDDDWYHSRVAILRAVETGTSLVRAASDGSVLVTDARGRVVVEASTGASGEGAVDADVSSSDLVTPYTRLGDLVAWLSCLAAVSIVVSFVRVQVSKKSAQPNA